MKTAVVEKVFGEEMQGLDFSTLHDIMLKDDDGTLRPFDQIYMKAILRAPGVWQILTTGDYCYLVEGKEEAVVIDTGYGIGNLRKMCQTPTDKPVKNCIITHEHFDHLGGISYFEKAYMTEQCKKVAEIPAPFAGPYEKIDYPVLHNIEVVEDGYVFDLGGRKLEVMFMPDHAAGSIMLLDRENRLLFSGDELGTPAYKVIGTTVEQYSRNIDRLYEVFRDIDWCLGGGFIYDNMVIYRQKHCLDRILKGYEAIPFAAPVRLDPAEEAGDPSYGRRLHSQVLMTNMFAMEAEQKMQMTYGYATIIYKKDKVFNTK